MIMKTKSILAALIIVAGLQSVKAQKMVVTLADNSKVTFSTPLIKDVTFFEAEEHEYVDLGLPSGTMWATCNVGATSPEDCGNYYAWGETRPKEIYHDSTYTYSANPNTLPSNRDAATANWGTGWRMPTKDDMIELMSNCAWRWTTINGVDGYIISGFNGNSIFLPTCGNRFDGTFYISKSTERESSAGGYYWLSTMGQAPAETATGFFSSPQYYVISRWTISYGCSDIINYRAVGQTVRPVYRPEE